MLLRSSFKSPVSRTALTLLCALSAISSVSYAAENSVDAGKFSPEQQSQIGQIAEDYLTAHPEKVGEVMATYLAEHPEFLVAAGKSLQQAQQQAQQQAFVQLALQNQAALLDKASPSVGPADAKAAMVMFFDYQCSYCSKMAPVIAALIKANPDVRFVFKEFPIFAQRWETSGFAARVGQQIWLSKGGDAYLAYHNDLYGTGKVEGQLTDDDVRKIAAPYLTKNQMVVLARTDATGPTAEALKANTALAQHMHFQGTPAFVVMPQVNGPDMKQVSVMPGSTSQEMLQMALQKAKG